MAMRRFSASQIRLACSKLPPGRPDSRRVRVVELPSSSYVGVAIWEAGSVMLSYWLRASGV